jgi:stage II sporulation protein D
MNRKRNDKGGVSSRLGVIATLLATVMLVGAGPAQAGETYARPADSTVMLSGAGFGHGRGMSQWGAYGAATQGRTWQQILAFYYQGTTLANLGNPRIRVRLDAVSQKTLHLPTPGGLRLAGQLLPVTIAGATVTRYSVASRPAGGVQVSALTSSGWSPFQVSASAAVLTNPSRGNVVDVLLPSGAKRGYRGSIVVNRATATSITPVSVLPMESYLRAVVPAEMPASWHPNAVRAQAVAARSYANFDRARTPAGRTWDTCDTTSCQMYSGFTAEHPLADAAVAATAGKTLTHLGKATFTQFGSANGGWTTAGSQPYLVAKADPYDGVIPSAANSWSRGVTAASIQARWPSIGTYRQLRIISRDSNGRWGGRVLTAAIDGSKGSVTVTGATIRFAFGLRSEWFVPTNSAAPAPTPAKVPAPTTVRPAPAKPPVVSAARTAYTAYKKVVLRQGSKGSAVVFLQRALKVKADGAFGPKTRAALVTFQRQQRIPANGIANRVVWDRLEKRASR